MQIDQSGDLGFIVGSLLLMHVMLREFDSLLHWQAPREVGQSEILGAAHGLNICLIYMNVVW